MKLAALALVTTLGLGGIAHADPAGPAPRSPHADADPPGPPRGELRQLLLRRFDRNGDGVLDAKERHRAIRALRRIARRMALEERRTHGEIRGRSEARDPAEQRARQEQRIRRLVQRFDRNGDGVVSPDEMPPGLARRMQQLDRNGDGWLDQRDRR